MNPQRWQRIDELLSAVLERDSGERASFLEKQCEGDEALRHEVESLLEAHDEADDFLEAPLFKTLPDDDAPRPDHRMRDCESCLQILPSLGYSLASPDSPTVTDLSGGEGWPAPSPFGPGERIGRYVVERLVGEGGMGTVYGARDPELGRVVALKLLRVRASGSEDSAGLRSRLLREAQAMARLAHPNVVTVFEVGTLGEQVFLAMELVEGGTLTRWLAERTRPWEEVLGVFLEAGRGLAAAHAAGLVHRDFKPDNVLVGADGRVRVMDFGLARAATGTVEGASSAADEPSGSPTSSGLTASLTRTGALLGTPAYMAPEQMRGEPVDARADLFSFCSSLYEALYGQRAFQADSLAKLRLQIEANEVSEAPPGRPVSTWLRRELLRGLRANPAERHETIDELLAALSKGKERPGRRKSLIAVGAFAILAAVLVVAGLRFGARPPQSSPNAVKAAPARRAVAILALKSLSGHPEKAWLSSAVTEMMNTELGSGRQLRVIPGENVAVAVRELGLAGANLPEPQALRKIGANLGADLLLNGSVTVLDAAQRLRVDLHLEDARTGEALANAAEVGEQDKLFELVTRLGARLRRELGLSVAEPDPAAHASFPANPEAARLFSEGLAQMRGFDSLAAKASFEGAAKISPTNPRILAALAQAYNDLGYEEGARDAAKRAFEAAEGLPRDERLSIEGLYRRTNKDKQRAVEIGRALVTFFPDDIEHRLRLGYDETIAGDRSAILATLEALRRLPLPAGSDPRIDLLEAQAQYLLGDSKRSREAAVRAVAAGRAGGMGRLVALGRYYEGRALRTLADPTGATAALRDAAKLFHDIGDRRHEALAIAIISILLSDGGDLAAAQERMEFALGVFRALGDRSGEAAALANLGVIHQRQHKMTLAVQRVEAAIAVYREIGDRRGVASSLYNRGNNLVDQGDLEGARQSFESSLAGYRELGFKDRQASALIGLGDIAVHRDQLANAQKLYREAKELQAAGEKVWTSAALLGLASAALEQKRFEEAETLAKQSSDLYRERGLNDNAARLKAVQARALLGLGRRTEAADRIAEAKALLAQTKVPNGYVVMAEAYLAAAEESPALVEALARLRALVEETRSAGVLQDELDLRLALAELQPRRDEAVRQLKILADDARPRGFLLIAHKSEAARQRLRPESASRKQ